MDESPATEQEAEWLSQAIVSWGDPILIGKSVSIRYRKERLTRIRAIIAQLRLPSLEIRACYQISPTGDVMTLWLIALPQAQWTNAMRMRMENDGFIFS